jgi:mgtE-like transporter
MHMKFRSTPKRVLRRAMFLAHADRASVKSGSIALTISLLAGLVAGIVLGNVTDTLLALPGLIVLAPAAIALRGNVFGALASRMSTMTRLGDVPFSRKLNTSVGQNLAASISLSIFCSFLLAIMAKIVSEAFGINNVITLSDFFVISIVGAIVPTIIVLIVTVFLAKICVKRDWDLDNIAAPIVTATGDLVTIPSLLFATLFVKLGWVTPVIAIISSSIAISLFAFSLFSKHVRLKRIVRESTPILAVGGLISIFAGITVQGRLESLTELPIFLVLVPPLLSINGSIGSILSSRIATKLHLGTIRSDKISLPSISEDIAIAYVLAIPIFLLLGIFASIFSALSNLSGPASILVIFVSLIAGLIATTLSNIVGYATAIVTYRFGLDPDNFAVPSVTSVSDLVGAVVLMSTIGVLVL